MENYIEQISTPGSGVGMRFGVLGPVTVSDGDTSLGIGGPKQRAVLAMLIANAGTQVAIESIIEAVWGDETPGNARRNVQTYVANLRSALGDLIVRESHGWRLAVERTDVDASEFQDLFESARDAVESSPERASVALREALAMWRGHPYADIEAHGALDGEIARLTELRSAVQAARVDADLAMGRDADLIGEIEALLAQNPYSERFRAQHMLALYRAGRQQEALRSCSDMRAILLEELGVEPTPELQQLELRILEQAEDLQASPTRTVTTRAVVVVHPGDPIAIGRLPADERAALLDRTAASVRAAIGSDPGAEVQAAGATTYIVVESAADAARVAEDLATSGPGGELHTAVDWGDVVLDDVGVHGPPVSRAAVMAAVGHPGQVLLSADAQQAVGSDPGASGFRFQTLGAHDLHGVDQPVLVYQLVIDGQRGFPELQTDRLPPPTPGAATQTVPGYELRAEFGPGSVGMLHRAFQPSVGREVLVEVIGAHVSSAADFVRNFEADAQRLALLDHQNVAAVIDYWRRPDGTFLVYRLPRGGTLVDGTEANADRVIRDIGAGLSYAHSFGMVHGSVRPDRVLLDDAGNASLIGFPIAGCRPPESVRFPAYIPPETLAGAPSDVATDVYALAVLAHELRTGPIDVDTTIESADPAISKALSENPTDRQSSIAELVRDLAVTDAEDPGGRFTEARNPYKGLAAFHERDARDFFGRTAVVEEMIEALGRSPLLAIVGPSGAGKSSVARAGLVPALRGGALPGSEAWMVTDMLPGAHPFLELQRAIERVAVDLPVGLTDGLASKTPDALRDAARVLPAESELLVLVDQFEELFTLTDELERGAFLDLIVAAIEQSHARFVLTMRADFLDHPLRYSEFGELLRRSTVMLRAPSREELADAIARPAAQVGVTVDAVLVERMVTDVHDQPGALPLLQHTLGELFERRTTDRIAVESFEAVGGVSGSLAQRAETIYTSLEADERHGVAQTFLRLVAVRDDGPPTRRRMRLNDLEDLVSSERLEPFVRARLLVQDNDPATRAPTVEVAHEALLTSWPRLAAWIDAAREDLTLSRRLDGAITEWEASDRRESYLLTDGRLAQHETWTESTSLALAPTAREYLDRSRAHDAAVRTRRRRIRKAVMAVFAIAAVIAGVLALVAVQNARTADEQTRLARAEALAASALAVIDEDPELAVLVGIEAIETAPDSAQASIALNQAIQSHRTIFRFDSPIEDERTLGSISPDGDLLAVAIGREVRVWDLAAPDEPLWVAVAADGDDLWEEYNAAYFSTDGQNVVVEAKVEIDGDAGGDGCEAARLRVFDARSGQIRRDIEIRGLIGFLAGAAQTGPFIDLDRSLILGNNCVDSEFSQIDLVAVDLATGEREVVAGEAVLQESIWGAPTINEDGTRLAIADRATVSVIDLRTGETFELETAGEGVSTLSADGALLLARTNPVELWDLEDEAKLRDFPGELTSAWFSSSEDLVYGATFDGRALVYERETGHLLFDLKGHGGRIIRLQMSDDESRLATFGADGTARVWDIASPWVATAGPDAFDADVEDSPGQFLLAVTHVAGAEVVAGRFTPTDGTLYWETARYDVATGNPLGTYPGIPLAVSRDGQRVALLKTGTPVELGESEVGDADPGVYTPIEGMVIADLVTGDTRVALDELCDWHFGFVEGASYEIARSPECNDEAGPWREFAMYGAFSPDDSLFAMAGHSGRVAVWETASGEVVWMSADGDAELGFGRSEGVEFSPDGSLLVSTFEVFVDVWDTETWTRVESTEFVPGPSQMHFTPDGDQLVFGHLDVVSVDVRTLEETSRLSGSQALLLDTALDPTGRFLATAGQDNESWVWDLDRGEVANRLPFPALDQGLRNVEWVDENTLLLGARPAAVLMTLDPAILARTARERLTRTFTAEECATYDIDPCPAEELRPRPS